MYLKIIGEHTKYEIKNGLEQVTLPGSIGIFPFTENGIVITTIENSPNNPEEFRERILCGILLPGESPLMACKREMAEELGLGAKNWRHLCTLKQDGTVKDERHFFIATNLIKFNNDTDDEVKGICYRPVEELYDRAMKGNFSVYAQAAISRLYYEINQCNKTNIKKGNF